MTRTIPADLLAALSTSEMEVYYAVDMAFDTGHFRIWTGYGNRQIINEAGDDNDTYIPANDLMSIGGLSEVSDLSATGTEITLNGISSYLVGVAFQQPYQNRQCRILLGEKSVSSVVEVFSGFMDTMAIKDNGTTANISLALESKLISLQRAKIRRYTSENQKSRFPDDTFFNFVVGIQEEKIAWGKLGYGLRNGPSFDNYF